MYILQAENISYIEAVGSFCKLYDDKGSSHVLSQSITSLYETLNPNHFFRINRGHIVNINHITGMENYFKNRLVLHMRGGKENIKTSSSTTAKFRIWLES